MFPFNNNTYNNIFHFLNLFSCFYLGLRLWGSDIPFRKSLENEVSRWKSLWHRKATDVNQEDCDSLLPHNLLQTLRVCDSDSFPNIHCLLIIGCTLPITSVESERSISLMRRLKTYSRSSMGEERFSDLAVIAMNYDCKITTDEVCESFVKSQPRRLFSPTLFS
jgi:hypothetical protein